VQTTNYIVLSGIAFTCNSLSYRETFQIKVVSLVVTPFVVFCLFNDAFSVTQTTQRLTNGYVNDEFERMWKMRSWPNLKYYPRICLRRRVYLYVGSNVSEEHTASNFRV
jgi:hypothetical protein